MIDRAWCVALMGCWVVSSCITASSGDDGVDLTSNSCEAESAVDWEASLGWVDLEAIERQNNARPRRFADLDGNDVAVSFEIGGNIHLPRENYGLAVRRDGEWTYQTAESPNSAVPPSPPPFPMPPPESHTCFGLHLKSRGAPTPRLEAALDAFLGDDCRARLPIYVPAPLHFVDPDAQSCGYGTTSSLRIETADGVENYAQTCPVPGSTLAELMDAFIAARLPVDPTYYGLAQSFSVTLDYPPSRRRLARACREVAEARGYPIDFDDPFEW